MIKPLDLVRTPKGGLALVTECSMKTEGYKINRYSIDYIENPGNEHNAWWMEEELIKLCSLPVIISKAMCHPFGNNEKAVDSIFM